MVYFAGLLILLNSSFPSFGYGASLFGLIMAMFFIGFGTGGIMPNVNSLVAEQYTINKDTVRASKSGELVIVDRALTIQR
jgi:dipeptide/tripeptide permease